VEMSEMHVLTIYIKFTEHVDLGGHGSGGGGVAPLPLLLPKGSAHQGTTLNVMEMPKICVVTIHIGCTQPIDLGGHGSGGRGVAPLPLPLPRGSAHPRDQH
jgi:hypothetical protein